MISNQHYYSILQDDIRLYIFFFFSNTSSTASESFFKCIFNTASHWKIDSIPLQSVYVIYTENVGGFCVVFFFLCLFVFLFFSFRMTYSVFSNFYMGILIDTNYLYSCFIQYHKYIILYFTGLLEEIRLAYCLGKSLMVYICSSCK